MDTHTKLNKIILLGLTSKLSQISAYVLNIIITHSIFITSKG